MIIEGGREGPRCPASRVAMRAALWRPYRDVNDRDVNFESFMSKA